MQTYCFDIIILYTQNVMCVCACVHASVRPCDCPCVRPFVRPIISISTYPIHQIFYPHNIFLGILSIQQCVPIANQLTSTNHAYIFGTVFSDVRLFKYIIQGYCYSCRFQLTSTNRAFIEGALYEIPVFLEAHSHANGGEFGYHERRQQSNFQGS